MEHIAIDLGSRESQVCIRDKDGAIVMERRTPTSRLAAMLSSREAARVIVETSAEALTVADAARAAGHQVRVVPATLVRALGVGARGIKTDVRDARVLSEASCRLDLPSVHLPAPLSRERKARCTAREALVSARTQLANTVRGLLRAQLIVLRPGHVETLPKRVRAKLEAQPSGVASYLEHLLHAIVALNAQIAQADAELEQLVQQDPTCQRLMTVPGVGPVTAMRFVAAIDQVGRFPSSNKLESYLGLTPGEKTTGFRERRTRITKAGPSSVRHCLGQAALSLKRARPNDPMVRWAKQVELRVGKHKATVALARKLAGVLYAIWRDSSVYDPRRSASARS
jgi:transposase